LWLPAFGFTGIIAVLHSCTAYQLMRLLKFFSQKTELKMQQIKDYVLKNIKET
jgi:hypothetical protein